MNGERKRDASNPTIHSHGLPHPLTGTVCELVRETYVFFVKDIVRTDIKARSHSSYLRIAFLSCLTQCQICRPSSTHLVQACPEQVSKVSTRKVRHTIKPAPVRRVCSMITYHREPRVLRGRALAVRVTCPVPTTSYWDDRRRQLL